MKGGDFTLIRNSSLERIVENVRNAVDTAVRADGFLENFSENEEVGRRYRTFRDTTNAYLAAIRTREAAQSTLKSARESLSRFDDLTGDRNRFNVFTQTEWLKPIRIENGNLIFSFDEDAGENWKVPVRIESPWEYLFAGTNQEQAEVPFAYKRLDALPFVTAFDVESNNVFWRNFNLALLGFAKLDPGTNQNPIGIDVTEIKLESYDKEREVSSKRFETSYTCLLYTSDAADE